MSNESMDQVKTGQSMASAFEQTLTGQDIALNTREGGFRLTVSGKFDFFFLKQENELYSYNGWGMNPEYLHIKKQ